MTIQSQCVPSPVSGMTSFSRRPRGRRQKVLRDEVTATELLSAVLHHSLGTLKAIDTPRVPPLLWRHETRLQDACSQWAMTGNFR